MISTIVLCNKSEVPVYSNSKDISSHLILLFLIYLGISFILFCPLNSRVKSVTFLTFFH